jgi:dTDP-4-dehydrorhamnose reductase
MNILLLGKDGQVGWELQRALAPLGHMVALNRRQCDLADPAAVRRLMRAIRPSVVVNAAAYTAVDRAESDAALCRAVNGVAPGILAAEAHAQGALLVHYSTDYVFDGRHTGLYAEHHATNPLNVYGASKLEGEQAILQSGCRHLIFRTSWVFAARGANFAKTMLRLARERDALNVVGDQFGAPTAAELIADVTALCLRDASRSDTRHGLFHLVASGETSWHEYARFVLAHAQQAGCALMCGPDRVAPIPASAYPAPAARPANSRLETAKLQREFGVFLPDWREGVARMLTEILPKENP